MKKEFNFQKALRELLKERKSPLAPKSDVEKIVDNLYKALEGMGTGQPLLDDTLGRLEGNLKLAKKVEKLFDEKYGKKWDTLRSGLKGDLSGDAELWADAIFTGKDWAAPKKHCRAWPERPCPEEEPATFPNKFTRMRARRAKEERMEELEWRKKQKEAGTYVVLMPAPETDPNCEKISRGCKRAGRQQRTIGTAAQKTGQHFGVDKAGRPVPHILCRCRATRKTPDIKDIVDKVGVGYKGDMGPYWVLRAQQDNRLVSGPERPPELKWPSMTAKTDVAAAATKTAEKEKVVATVATADEQKAMAAEQAKGNPKFKPNIWLAQRYLNPWIAARKKQDPAFPIGLLKVDGIWGSNTSAAAKAAQAAFPKLQNPKSVDAFVANLKQISLAAAKAVQAQPVEESKGPMLKNIILEELVSLIKEKKKKDPKAKVRNRGTVVFPAESSKVKDDKDHFPINSEAQARNALSRASQYSKGTLKSLVSAVQRKVKAKYKGIETTKASAKPGKG